MSAFTYGIPPNSSVVLLFILALTYGIPHTLSFVPSYVPVSNHGILSSGVHHSSIVPSHIDTKPSRLTIALISSITVISSDDQNRFKIFIRLGHPTLVVL